jgi:hypothetical protein
MENKLQEANLCLATVTLVASVSLLGKMTYDTIKSFLLDRKLEKELNNNLELTRELENLKESNK